MLKELQLDLRELIELVRQVENYDVTTAAVALLGKPIETNSAAIAERESKGLRITQLRRKWNI